MATGKTMDKHGILGFLEQQTQKDAILPNSRLSRRFKALWNILSNHGYAVGLVGLWVIWPAETVNGFILTDRMYFENITSPTFPAELKSYLYRMLKPQAHSEISPPFRALMNMLNPAIRKVRTPLEDNLRNARMYFLQDLLKGAAGLELNPAFCFSVLILI
jgi:hypothetical protein